jgi:hypothetical protein
MTCHKICPYAVFMCLILLQIYYFFNLYDNFVITLFVCPMIIINFCTLSV